MNKIHRNARPFYWPGESSTAFLLVHGFTGSPADMRILGEYLGKEKYGVSGILLPGHGTTPEDMSVTGWEDWYEAVLQAYLDLKNSYAQVIPIGLSMGGLLCLHLAAHETVPAVVSLSAPVYMGDERIYQAPEMDAAFVGKELSLEEQAKKLAEGRFSYEIVPVKCLVSLLKLIELVKRELSLIQVPALIIHSEDDPTAKPESARYLDENLGSKNKERVLFNESGHVITLGPEKHQVFDKIKNFLSPIIHSRNKGRTDLGL